MITPETLFNDSLESSSDTDRVCARITSRFTGPDMLQIWLGELDGIRGVAGATSRISQLRTNRR